MQPHNIRCAIESMGHSLGPEVLTAVHDLFDVEQRQAAARIAPLGQDIAYGPDARHRLDLYSPPAPQKELLPILVFAHGGGFLKGDKGSTSDWRNANVGRMAANAGLLGVVINYRLAPAATWPAGGEDVGLVVEWCKAHSRDFGADPERIVLMGTSAGAVHVATALKIRPGLGDELRGLVLLSGLYGITPLDERDTLYYGDPRLYAQRWPLEALTETLAPLLVARAEFDPPRFQAEFIGLMQKRLDAHGHLPRSCIAAGQNHYSITQHLGTSDTRLADEIIGFCRQVCR